MIWFHRLFARKAEAVEASKGRANNDACLASWKAGRCPDCGSNEYYEGPTGGACINIKCAGCGSKFNLCFGFGQLFSADRIG